MKDNKGGGVHITILQLYHMVQEMDYQKGQKQSSVVGADTTVPALGRHENQPFLPTSENHSTLKRHGTLSLSLSLLFLQH